MEDKLCFILAIQMKEVSSAAAAAAKSLQSCPTLCDPIDGSPPGSPTLGFSRQEHWSGLPFPSPGNLPDPGIKPASLTCIAVAVAKSLQSCPTLCDPIDGSPPGSPTLGFSRQEHWSRLPFPSPTHESEK